MNSTVSPVLVVIGPSGSGKSTVVRRLASLGLVRVHPTYTTRAPRPNEQMPDAAPEHVFCSDAEFDRLVEAGRFLGVVQPFGLAFRYGLPRFARGAGGPVDCVMLRAPFVEEFRAMIPEIVVYQIEVDAARARERMTARGDSSEDAEARLSRFDDELVAGRRLADRTFVNHGSLDALIAEISTGLAA